MTLGLVAKVREKFASVWVCHGTFVFYRFFYFDFHYDLQTEKLTYLNPGPAPAPQPAASPQHSHHPGEEEKHQNPGSCPGYFQEKKEDAI